MHSGPLKRVSVATCALVAAVMVVLPVAADAPISGPDRQYEPFVRSDVTITDRFTKLRWSRPKEGQDYPVLKLLGADGAAAFCAALQSSRLPTLKELLTLVDEEPHPEYIVDRYETRYIDKRAFEGTPSGQPFWTSSKANGGTYAVDFSTGMVDNVKGPNDARAVICVK